MRWQLWKKIIFTAVVVSFVAASPARASDFWWDLFNRNSDCVQLTASAEALFMNRDTRVNSGGNVINGPDAGRLAFDKSDFDYESGYRLSLGIQTPANRIEVLYADYGTWSSGAQGSLTEGLLFDDSFPLWPGGANSLSTTTFFTPMHVAATGPLGGEGDEAEGLGPNTIFADATPTYSRYYQSDLQDLQVNWMENDPCANVRFGLGFRNVQLDEAAGMRISGIFRAPDIGVSNGGLSHLSLVGPAGLTLISGLPDGFEDESLLGNNGAPDVLILDYSATTQNDLNGFQAIVDACLIDNGRFEVTVIGKAGAFHNHASGRVQERYTGIGPDTSVYGRNFSDTKDSVAFVGGVGVQGSVRVTDWVSVTAGYEGTFISGVALSPEQAAGVRGGTYEVKADGNVIVHGATVGLLFTY